MHRLISFTSIRAKEEVRGGGGGCVRAERPQTDRQARSAPRSRRVSERAANAFSDRSTFLSAPREKADRGLRKRLRTIESLIRGLHEPSPSHPDEAATED